MALLLFKLARSLPVFGLVIQTKPFILIPRQVNKMRISEVVRQLNEILEHDGDLVVEIETIMEPMPVNLLVLSEDVLSVILSMEHQDAG